MASTWIHPPCSLIHAPHGTVVLIPYATHVEPNAAAPIQRPPSSGAASSIAIKLARNVNIPYNRFFGRVCPASQMYGSAFDSEVEQPVNGHFLGFATSSSRTGLAAIGYILAILERAGRKNCRFGLQFEHPIIKGGLFFTWNAPCLGALFVLGCASTQFVELVYYL